MRRLVPTAFFAAAAASFAASILICYTTSSSSASSTSLSLSRVQTFSLSSSSTHTRPPPTMMSRFPFFILLSHLLASSSFHLPNNHYTGWMLDPEWYQDSGDSFHIPNLPYHPAQLHDSEASQSSPAAAKYATHPEFSSQDFPKGNSRVVPSVDFSDEPLAYELGEWWTDPEFFNEPLQGVESAAEDADFEPKSSPGLKDFFAQLKTRLHGFKSVSEEESVPNAFRFIRDKEETARRSLRAI